MKLNILKQPYISLIITIILISLTFIPTVNRDWQMFDEKDIYYNESLYPIPLNLPEFFEVIYNYVPNFNFESQNLQFSNITNIRSNPVGAACNILLSYVFKKNSLLFHLLNVLIHILNSILIWLIFKKTFEIQKIPEGSFFSSVITLIWALHPVNTEAVMMSTNWNSIFAYSFFFLFFLHSLKKINKEIFHNSRAEGFILTLVYFLCILLIEYSYTFPLIIFFSVFAFTHKHYGTISKSLRCSVSLSYPYFAGLILYVLFYFIRHSLLENISYQTLNFSIERFLWFSPQICIHFFKLFFYPVDLSIYQSNLIHFADSYFEPYSIFSFSIFALFLILPVILLRSQSFPIYGFIFSIFPFLHIIAPSYCIFSERYCYLPLFLFLFSTIYLLTLTPFFQNKKISISLLILILIPLFSRTIFRLSDWKDSYSLYLSATKTAKTSLYKGLGYANVGYYFKSINDNDKAKKYFSLSIETLDSEITKFKPAKNSHSPKTLKTFGLDTNTSILNAAFRIASIRFYDFKDAPSEILNFYRPYIDKDIETAGSSQLDLYAKLLSETNQSQKALEILEFAKEKYPFSTTIIFSLSNFYLNQKDISNAEKIITEGLTYYPNYVRILPRIIKLCWLKKDLPNLAKYEYLLGLRTHSEEAYQKSLQLYLSLNKQNEAKRIIDKLLFIDKNNPVTLLLARKYYSLKMGQRNER